MLLALRTRFAVWASIASFDAGYSSAWLASTINGKGKVLTLIANVLCAFLAVSVVRALNTAEAGTRGEKIEIFLTFGAGIVRAAPL